MCLLSGDACSGPSRRSQCRTNCIDAIQSVTKASLMAGVQPEGHSMAHESSQQPPVRMNRRELLGTATALIGGAVVGVAGNALPQEKPNAAASAAATGPN